MGYNINNHEIDDVHGDTQAKPLRAATLRGFFFWACRYYFFLSSHLVIRLPTTPPTIERTRLTMYSTASTSFLTERDRLGYYSILLNRCRGGVKGACPLQVCHFCKKWYNLLHQIFLLLTLSSYQLYNIKNLV